MVIIMFLVKEENSYRTTSIKSTLSLLLVILLKISITKVKRKVGHRIHLTQHPRSLNQTT